jgi:hypothetical protein
LRCATLYWLQVPEKNLSLLNFSPSPRLDIDQIEEDVSLKSLGTVLHGTSRHEVCRADGREDIEYTQNSTLIPEYTPAISHFANISRIPKASFVPRPGSKVFQPRVFFQFLTHRNS